jgi:hypothetical protein
MVIDKLRNSFFWITQLQARNPPPAWLIYPFIIFLIIPKINVIQIAGQTSGIRIDDIFLLVVTPYLLMHLVRYWAVLQGLQIYLFFVLLSLISALFQIETNGWKLLLYPARLIEYLVFILAGAMCTDRNLLVKISIAIVTSNTVAAFGQVFFNLGGFPYSRYTPSIEGRAIGLGAGPWEMAAIVNLSMACLYYAWGNKSRNFTAFFIMYLVSLAGLILTESRVGITVSTLMVALFIFQLNFSIIRRLFAFCTIAALSAAMFFAVPNSLKERSNNLVSQGNLSQSAQTESQGLCGPHAPGRELNFPVVNDQTHDPSWGVRAKKWATASCIFLSESRHLLLGTGPGYFGPALDGGFVRILVEHGSLGLLALLLALIGFDSAFRNYRIIAMVFAAHMVFIDIYLSYKFTSLLLFLLGAMLKLNNDRRPTHALSN